MAEKEPTNTKSRKEFHEKKKELSKIRTSLISCNKEKEEAYQQLRTTKEKIRSRTARIKELKKERDDLTKEVKQVKESRDKENQTMKEKSTARKEVDKKKKELMDKLKIKEDPAKLKVEIDKLEQKIETEVMPFTKEQQIRKKIKELKTAYKKVEKVLHRFGRIRIQFPDYVQDKDKRCCWNGVYSDIEPPNDYKKALMELIIFGMKLRNK